MSPVLLVAAGGALGSLARAGVGVTLPHEPGSWGWATLLVNAVGAALLMALLARRPGDRVRLALGTGALGGFTTFSGFAVDAVVNAPRKPVTSSEAAGPSSSAAPARTPASRLPTRLTSSTPHGGRPTARSSR